MPRVGIQIHYQCSFDLSPSAGGAEFLPWSDVVKEIRRWISHKERETLLGEEVHRQWFFIGGARRNSGRFASSITTECWEGIGDRDSPDCWALSYEHPCSDHPDQRRWRTEIGLARTPAGYRVSLVNSHWIVPGYLGEEPSTPLASAPRLVLSLIESRKWRACAGGEELRTTAESLPAGGGKAWVDRLKSRDRTCSLVFLSPFSDGRPCGLDADRLAALLAGTAVIVRGEPGALDAELSWLLPKPYRCWEGAVRVYAPGLDLADPHDSRRHRFFSAARIAAHGAEATENMLIVGLARRAPVGSRADVTSPDDVGARRREAKFAETLRRAAAASDDQILKALYEESNQALVRRVNELEEQKKDLARQVDDLMMEHDELREANDDQQTEVRSLRAELQKEAERARKLERGLEAFQKLEYLPRRLDEVVELVAKVFSDRLVFTERAVKSAAAAAINDRPNEMARVWALFRAMATTLYSIHFDRVHDEGGDIDRDFESKTGFEHAITEGKLTKSDRALMKLREESYDGRIVDITPHVKYGDNLPPRYLRVYYCPDHPTRRLVIGHCGDHLDTAGTRRM